jgi:hypothetical protein
MIPLQSLAPPPPFRHPKRRRYKEFVVQEKWRKPRVFEGRFVLLIGSVLGVIAPCFIVTVRFVSEYAAAHRSVGFSISQDR